MFSYKANAMCMAGMTMPAGAGVVASHCWNRVRKPGQLINCARFWPHRWTFAKNRTAHAQTHYRKSTQWQWASFVSAWSFFLEPGHCYVNLNDDWWTWHSFSAAESSHHVVLGYAWNVSTVFRWHWPPESNSEWFKCVLVERSEIRVKMHLLVKNTCF